MTIKVCDSTEEREQTTAQKAKKPRDALDLSIKKPIDPCNHENTNNELKNDIKA